MDQAKLTGKFDLVMLLIGVNNQFQGRSEEEYRQQFSELLKRAEGHVKAAVVMQDGTNVTELKSALFAVEHITVFS